MKHRLFKLVLFLILGAIVNVAVAWGCAFWSNPYVRILPLTISDTDEGSIFYVENYYESFGTKVRIISRHWGGELHVPSDAPLDIGELAFPLWIDKEDFRKPKWMAFDSRGWPTQSLWSALEQFGSMNAVRYECRSGWRIGQSQISHGGRQIPRTVPLHPIWPGFAIDTAFYAILVYLLWLTQFTTRRMIRRKRGRCIKCGYDLRNVEHEKCPECGAGVS